MDYRWLIVVGGGMAFWLFTIALEYAMGERPTKDAPDLGESSASDSESKPAPKRVI